MKGADATSPTETLVGLSWFPKCLLGVIRICISWKRLTKVPVKRLLGCVPGIYQVYSLDKGEKLNLDIIVT